MLVSPQLLELGGIVLVGRPTHLGGQREYGFRQLDPPAARERDVREQRRRARGTVDQGHALLGRRRDTSAQFEEETPQRQDLARPAVRLSRHSRQRGVIEHSRHRLRKLTSHRSVAIEEVRQTSHDNRSHDTLGERIAE